MAHRIEWPKKVVAGYVDFHFDKPNGERVLTVRFCHEQGRPGTISFFIPEQKRAIHVVDNRDGRYKPCMTHAKELVWLVVKEPAAGSKPCRGTNQAKQRRAASKPGVRIFNPEFA
jgi:hypothetical protein